MGGLLRLCAGLTRLGRTAAAGAAGLLVLAHVGDAAVFMAMTAVGLHLGTLLLDGAGHEVVEEDEDLRPGLGPFAYSLQGLLGLLAAAWISMRMDEQPTADFAIGDWVEKAMGVGLLYTAAGVVAVIVTVVGNPLGCRSVVARRAVPLLAAPAGGLLVFLGLNGVLVPLNRWTAPLEQESADFTGEHFVMLIVSILVMVALLGAMAGLVGVVLFGRGRFQAHRYHPVLPPVMDLCVAGAGVATLAYTATSRTLDSRVALEGMATVVMLSGFAVVDLYVQRQRLLRQQPARRASPRRALPRRFDLR